MKYSFILPAYKAQFFREALDSILAQTYKDFELIIVNDASPEDLDSIVKSYNDPRIRYYVNEKNIGGKDLIAQWNHCLEYAKGEYVILASDDDVYSPLYLEKMDELVCKYPDVNVFSPRVQSIDSEGNLGWCVGEYSKEFVPKLEFIRSWINCWIRSGIPFYLFSRESLQRIGGFVNLPLAWFSDDATVIKLLDHGMVHTSEILFFFRISGISISTKLHTKEVLVKKMEATKRFYDMVMTELESVNVSTSEEKSLKSEITDNLPGFLFHHKILSQIFNAPFSVVMGIYGYVYSLDFVPKRLLVWEYLKYIIKKILYFN